MDDSLKHARAAAGRKKYGEALVYLWSALDYARATEDPGEIQSVGSLAERIAERGDEVEEAEAEQLLIEVDRAFGEPFDADVGTFQTTGSSGGFEVDPDDMYEDDAPAEKTVASRLWGFVGLAVFLFFILRDVIW
jgi:hypothetical protein